MRYHAVAAAILLTGGQVVIAQSGAQIYKDACSQCHDQPQGRTPARMLLAMMTRENVVRALESGVMAEQGKALPPAARVSVASYLTKVTETGNRRYLEAGACADSGPRFPQPGPSWSRWGLDSSNSRFQPADAAGLTASAVPKLALAWAVALPGEIAARSQPAIHGGRVFAASSDGAVLALDAQTGCRYWAFSARSGIRGGVIAGDAVYFGDSATNVYALDPRTGREQWRTQVGEHGSAVSTGTPQLHNGVLYVGISSAEELTGADPRYSCCTFRGSIVALNAATGKVKWRTHTVPEPKPTRKNKIGTQLYGPSGAGVWSTPTIDAGKGLLYVATGDNFSDPPTAMSDSVLALELETGRIVWSRQFTAGDAFNVSCGTPGGINCPEANGPDFDFGQPPILVMLGGEKRALVIGQKSGMVHALDPDNRGEILWQTRVAKGGTLGGIQWGSAADSARMYVAIGDIRIAGVAPGGGMLADPKHGGGLAALDLATGKPAWTAKPPVCGDRPKCSPAQSAAVTAIPGVVFSGSLDGFLRAYSTEDGRVIWEFDTTREFDTVNGVRTHGGSIDAHGPVIAGGLVLTGSGFGNWGGMPGNVLLAFRAPK